MSQIHRLTGLVVAGVVCLVLGLAGVTAAAAGPRDAVDLTSFRAQSVAFSTPAQGWVLGTALCGERPCTTVAATDDGGKTWDRRGVVPAPLAPPGEPGVTTMRFADAAHGFAFGPSLYLTRDGGRRWQASPLPGGATQVLDLAASRGTVYLATSTCPLGQGQCSSPSRLWRSQVGVPVWQPVPVQLPASLGVHLSTWGRTAYVVGVNEAGQDTFAATTDGWRWSARPSPCAKDGVTHLVAADAYGPRAVALLCVGDPGFAQAVKTAYRSPDTGLHSTSAGTAPLPGSAAELGVSPTGTLLTATVGQQSFLYLNPSGATWSNPYLDPNGYPWADPTFTGAGTGYIVHGPASTPGFPGQVLATNDAGAHWAPLAIGS